MSVFTYINYSNSDKTAVCYFINIMKYTFFLWHKYTIYVSHYCKIYILFCNKMLHFVKTCLVSCIIRYSTTSLLRYYNMNQFYLCIYISSNLLAWKIKTFIPFVWSSKVLKLLSFIKLFFLYQVSWRQLLIFAF